MITFTTGTALLSGVVFVLSGAAGFGILKLTVLDGMLKIITALEKEVAHLKGSICSLEADNKTTRAELGRLKSEGELKGRQLSVSLRVIEYFERVITVVIKGRPRMPKDLAAAVDDGLRELAEFRQRATLDLESLSVNRDHYDWLLAREALMGPDRSASSPTPADAAYPADTNSLSDTKGL